MRSTIRVLLGVLLALITTLPLLAQQVATRESIVAQAFRSTNVRSGPGVDYDVIGRLREGDFAPIVGRSDESSNWLLIDQNGQQGWVAFFTVSVTGNLNSLPIIMPDSPPQPSLTAQPPEAPLRADTNVFASAYRRVNVRSGPGAEFPVIGVLAPGDTADIIGASGNPDEWLKINFRGQSGWVAYFVVNINGDMQGLVTSSTVVATQPGVISGPTQTPRFSTTDVVIITRFNVNLRDSPELAAPVLRVIPWQTTMEANGRNADGTWLRVRYNNQDGWLITSLVDGGASDMDALPVVAAPSLSATAVNGQ